MAQQILTHILESDFQQVKPLQSQNPICRRYPLYLHPYASESQPDVHIEPIIRQMIEQVIGNFNMMPTRNANHQSQSSKRRRCCWY